MPTFLIVLLLAPMAAGDPLTSGDLSIVAEGFLFTEGPLWVKGQGLLFSDIPADAIFRTDKTAWRTPSGESNGLTLDPQGRLIAAEHKNRRLSRTEKDGAVSVLAERYENKRLNSPNDVVARSDGFLFFTDPPYGLKGGLGGPEAELDFAGVFALAPDGALCALIKDFKKPNGIALSPDEKTLYVADTEGHHIRAFDLAPGGTISNDRVFAPVPHPDGMKVSAQGNIWCAAKDGVHVISPEGQPRGIVAVPQQPANCAFGGEDAQTLYITARSAVYKVRITEKGMLPGPK